MSTFSMALALKIQRSAHCPKFVQKADVLKAVNEEKQGTPGERHLYLPLGEHYLNICLVLSVCLRYGRNLPTYPCTGEEKS